MSDCFQIAVFALAVASSSIASLTGFGIGSLLTPLLASSMELKLAVALVSLPHFVATTLRCFMLRAHIDKKVMIHFGIASAIGGLLGALAHNYFKDPMLMLVFAGLLIIAGFLAATGLSRKFILPKALNPIAGVLSGAFGGLVGNQGGIRAAALLNLGLSKESFVATGTAIGVIVDLARMPVYLGLQSQEIFSQYILILNMTLGCILGTWLGKRILSKIPEAIFSRIVGLIILSLGIYLAIKH